MALGARVGDVQRLVMRQGLVLALVGSGIGLLVVLALSHGLSGLLIEVSADRSHNLYRCHRTTSGCDFAGQPRPCVASRASRTSQGASA